MPGAAVEFAQAIESLGGRRLPILIHSPGGSVADAMAMGELIRAKGLAVAVARTLITNCPERAPKCPSGPGRAMTGGAMCASACVLMLAGGVERLVGPAARVGVHQITTLVKETEGSAHLTSTRKIYEQAGVDEVVTHYLTAMGVGDPVMALMRKTPAASIRWLSLADLRASGLATRALDAAEPIATSGANGLNARAFDGDRRPFVQASVAKPFGGQDAALDIAFRYRRGGGAVEAEATPRDSGSRLAADPPAVGWSLTLNARGGEPLRLTAAGTAPAARHHPARTLLRARERRQPRRRAGPRRLDGRGGGRTAGGGRDYRNGRGEGADRGSLSLTADPADRRDRDGQAAGESPQQKPSRPQQNPSRAQQNQNPAQRNQNRAQQKPNDILFIYQ